MQELTNIDIQKLYVVIYLKYFTLVHRIKVIIQSKWDNYLVSPRNAETESRVGIYSISIEFISGGFFFSFRQRRETWQMTYSESWPIILRESPR